MVSKAIAGACVDDSAYAFTKYSTGARTVQTDMLQRPMFNDFELSEVPRRCFTLSLRTIAHSWKDLLLHIVMSELLW